MRLKLDLFYGHDSGLDDISIQYTAYSLRKADIKKKELLKLHKCSVYNLYVCTEDDTFEELESDST